MNEKDKKKLKQQLIQQELSNKIPAGFNVSYSERLSKTTLTFYDVEKEVADLVGLLVEATEYQKAFQSLRSVGKNLSNYKDVEELSPFYQDKALYQTLEKGIKEYRKFYNAAKTVIKKVEKDIEEIERQASTIQRDIQSAESPSKKKPSSNDNDAVNVNESPASKKDETLDELLNGDTFIDVELDNEALKKSKPNWWNIQLEFESDFDKACYIIHNRKIRSTNDALYVAWCKEVSGKNLRPELIKHGTKIKKVIRLIIVSEGLSTQNDGTTGKVTIPKVPLDFTPSPKQSRPRRTTQPSGRQRSARRAANFVSPSGGARSTRTSARRIAQAGYGAAGDVIGILNSIQVSLENILGYLQNQQVQVQRRLQQQRRETELTRREQEEKRLEESAKKTFESFKKVFTPIQGILDKIIDFIVYTILGRAFTKMMQWVSNPQNKEKIETLKRFFKDWWPALLGAFVLFGTSFGKFVRSTVGMVIRLGKYLTKTGVPGLMKLLGAFGKKAAIAAAAVGGTVALYQFIKPDEKEKEQNTPGGPVQSFRMGGSVFPSQARRSQETNINDLSLDESQVITSETGQKITGAGPDTQLVAAKPGEVFLTQSDVGKLSNQGVDLSKFLAGRQPQYVNNIQLANKGGFVGKAVKHLQEDEALSSLSPGVNDMVRPGTPKWSKVHSNTLLHAYLDSVGKPTIGWGSTFYDSILNGRKPVRMGDKITKAKADNIFNTNVFNLSEEYSKKIPYWENMSDNQKAGLLLVGYNAPYGPIGAYPNLTGALRRGSMIDASKHIQRGGPSLRRIATERSLLLQGPQDVSKKQEKPEAQAKPKRQSGGFMETLKDVGEKFMNLIAPSSVRSASNYNVPGQRPRKGTTTVSEIDLRNRAQNQSSAPASTDVPDFDINPPSLISDRQEIKNTYGIGAMV